MAELEGKHPNYWKIWAWLAVLTGVEVWIASTDLGTKMMIFVLMTFAVVKALLTTRPDARALDLPAQLPGETTAVGRQWLPEAAGNDGFFYALLEKNRPPSQVG